MTPEERLQQASAAVDKVESRAEIDQLIDDLQFVYDALHPREQELATGVIGKLREKRRGV